MGDAGRSEAVVGNADAARTGPSRRWIRWTRKLKGEFLDRLAGSCNITASAQALGIDPTLVHHLRRRDADFASAWEVAIEAGYVMIETRLIGHVLAGGSRDTPIPPAGGHTEAIDVEQALRVLSIRDGRQARIARGDPRKSGARPLRASREETDAAILRMLRAGSPTAADAEA